MRPSDPRVRAQLRPARRPLTVVAIASVVLTEPSTQTVAIGLFQLVSGFQSQNWGVFSAGALLAALPVMVFFLMSQRYLVGGMISGSVK